MKKILLILAIVIALILSTTCLLINFNILEKKISFIDYSSGNIFPDNQDLDSNIIIFKSNVNIAKYKIKSECENEANYLGKNSNLYFFKIKVLEKSCENPTFILTDGKKDYEKTNFNLNIKTKTYIFNSIIDYSNTDLEKFDKIIDEKIKKFSEYNNIKTTTLKDLKNNRIYKELIYNKEILNSIIERRNLKYVIPVEGYDLPTEKNIIPNAGRPYRSNYTDGVHHGWDIVAPFGTTVRALDDGIIIRVIKDFSFENISKMKTTGEITPYNKVKNLDILRGNQIWLKTSKGDIIFYSHLSKVYDGIEEGKFISVGTDMGEVGKSGVPDKDYKNFHLHFTVQKNPYSPEKAGKYTFEDYMNWDWYFKGLSLKEVLEGQEYIFEK